MKNKNKGFIVPVLLGIIALLVIGGGIYIYKNEKVEAPIVPVDIETQTTTQTQQSTTKKPSDSLPVSTNEIPNIIGKIRTNPETGDQKPEINSQILDQVRKDVQNGKLSWFKDPVEVTKKYGNRFGIESGSQYFLEQPAFAGEDSGLMHSTVLVASSNKSYRIHLISEQNQPYVWSINAVSNLLQLSSLRVNSFSPASTYDTDKVGHQDIVNKFGDGSTLFYLNVKKPVVTFSLNQPAKSSTVGPDSVIVKINNIVLSGATAKAVTEQGSYQGATFPTHSIQVDLSGISKLKNYVGQNVQIILTDKIKDNLGNSLQQCDRAYNIGECIADKSGQKIKAFGAELKLYSI